jgi:hypothetical protein
LRKSQNFQNVSVSIETDFFDETYKPNTFFIRGKREIGHEDEEENICSEKNPISKIGSKPEIALIVQALIELWLKTHLATSRDCLQKLICVSNEEMAQKSALAWTLAETGR